jgi:hypothetical protein
MSILKELKEMITARGGNAGSANTVAQAVDALTDLGGGGGSSSYVATLTATIVGISDGLTFEYSIDKTFEEIANAYNDGAQVLLRTHYEVADGVDADLETLGISDTVEKVWTASDSAIMCHPQVRYYVSGYKEYEMKSVANVLWYENSKLMVTEMEMGWATIHVD